MQSENHEYAHYVIFYSLLLPYLSYTQTRPSILIALAGFEPRTICYVTRYSTVIISRLDIKIEVRGKMKERERERERGSPPFTRRTVAISVTPCTHSPQGSPHCTYKKRDKVRNKKVMSYIDVN